MTNGDIGQAILEEIRRLGGRFDRLEARFDGVETRLGALETRLESVETRLESVETRLESVETRLGELETRLGALETRLEGVETRLGVLEGRFNVQETRLEIMEKRIAVLETVVAELNVELRSWPDMHYLASSSKVQMNQLRAVKVDVLDIKGRIGEVFQTMATAPEIQMLRDEVSMFRDQSLEMDVRLGVLERRAGIRAEPPTL
jgi:chromosome segregation ATPase